MINSKRPVPECAAESAELPDRSASLVAEGEPLWRAGACSPEAGSAPPGTAGATEPVDLRRRCVTGAIVGAGVVLAAGVFTPGSTRAATSVTTVKLRELYNKDFSFSARARSLEGQRVAVSGYMAPPLKADARFFVLTKLPMATCPFCSSAADWPRDILAVYTRRTIDVMPFNVTIVASGILELGTYRDESTGFVSRVRLGRATVERV